MVKGRGKTPTLRNLAFVLGQRMSNESVGVPVPHAMLVLQPGDMLHMLGRRASSQQSLPFADRTPVLLLDEGKVGGGSLDCMIVHEAVATPEEAAQSILGCEAWASTFGRTCE